MGMALEVGESSSNNVDVVDKVSEVTEDVSILVGDVLVEAFVLSIVIGEFDGILLESISIALLEL